MWLCYQNYAVNNNLEPFLEFAREYEKDTSISDERDNTVFFPIDSEIPEMLTELENRKEELGVTSVVIQSNNLTILF
jgi:hypothetical protein